MTRLFIYGTLKRGCSNHSVLAGQKFQDEARTVPGYTLYSLGNYPGMIAQAVDKTGVQGEIWSVDEIALARLDAFEGVSEGLYTRELVQLMPPHAKVIVETFIYARSIKNACHLGSIWSE